MQTRSFFSHTSVVVFAPSDKVYCVMASSSRADDETKAAAAFFAPNKKECPKFGESEKSSLREASGGLDGEERTNVHIPQERTMGVSNDFLFPIRSSFRCRRRRLRWKRRYY